MAEIIFFDETGVNPLPAGLFITLYAAPNPPAQPAWSRVNNQVPLPVYDGILSAGGVFFNPNIVLQGGASYGAVFTGTQAPGMCEANFVANSALDTDGSPMPSIANASAYASPSHSQIGYTIDQTRLWPKGWFSDAARSPGGVAYALAYGLAGLLGSPIINGLVDDDPGDQDNVKPFLNNAVENVGHFSLDRSVQGLLGEMRLGSSVGPEIDSWALDILGNVFLRCIDESDYAWQQQITQILKIFRDPGLPTVAGLQAILSMLYPCIILEFEQVIAVDTKGGVDTWGGLDVVPNPPGAGSITMGLDTFGAMDVGTTFMDVSETPTVLETPNVVVFDAQSNPTLATLIAPNIVPPQFCVYFQYPSFSDTLIHPIAPLIPQLVALVNACKALGTVPIFAANVT